MRNKYGAKKVQLDGYTFDSQLEAQRWQQLQILLTAGAIRELSEPHKEYTIVDKTLVRGKWERAVKHEVDFDYVETTTHQHVVEDVKGYATAVWKLKRRLFVERYPHIEYRIVTKEDMY